MLGSEEERIAVIRANQDSTKKGLYDEGKQSVSISYRMNEKNQKQIGNFVCHTLFINVVPFGLTTWNVN